MTEEQIKEALSRGFVRLVANRRGFKCKFDESDHGVDLTLSEVAPRILAGGGLRLTDTGRYVDLQIKCTTDACVAPTDTGLKFDLEVKTYNDLVARLEDPSAAPMALVLFVLPDDDGDWLSVGEEQLLLRRAAYWWRPASGTKPTDNTTTIRIEIPHAQRANVDFAPTLYAEFFP